MKFWVKERRQLLHTNLKSKEYSFRETKPWSLHFWILISYLLKRNDDIVRYMWIGHSQINPFCNFMYSRTNFFHNLITNYSESSSRSCFMILMILSGWDRLSNFFSTKAINFSSTPPMYSLLISSSQGRICRSRTVLLDNLSQSITNCHKSILFWGTCFSS